MANMRLALSFRLLALVLLCRSAGAASTQSDEQLLSAPNAPHTKVDYANVRARVAHAFAEKAHEMSETVAVLQGLSRETRALVDTINANCGMKLEATPAARRTALRG